MKPQSMILQWLRVLTYAGLIATQSSSLVAKVSGVRVAGSDFLKGSFEKVIDDNIHVGSRVFFLGSSIALDALQSGDVDVALVAVPEGTAPEKSAYEWVPFAFAVCYVAVSHDNPIEALSVADLKLLYTAPEPMRWGQLTQQESWKDAMAQPVFFEAGQHFASRLFEYKVLKDGNLGKAVSFARENQSLADLFRVQPGVIAVLAEKPEGSDQKIIGVSQESGEKAVMPIESNIYYGDYPLVLPFFAVFPDKTHTEQWDAIKPFVQWLLSDEGTASLKEKGWVPVAENTRKRLLQTLDI